MPGDVNLRRSFLAIAMLLALNLGPLPRATAQEKTDQNPQQIRQLISRLGSDLFSERQQAVWDLAAIGKSVLPPLRLAIDAGDPETQLRAVMVVGNLAVAKDRDCQRAAQDLLSELAQSTDQNIRNLASQTIDGLGEAMAERAIQDLTDLGATIEFTQFFDGTRQVRSFVISIDESFRGESRDCSMLGWLDGPTSLTLIGEQIDSSVIEQLKGVDSLTSLIIKRGSLDSQALKHFVGLPDLRILHFYYVPIDNDAAEILAEMKQLGQLRLIGTKMTQRVCQTLQSKLTATEVDWRSGAFLGIYFNDTTGPCIVSNVVQDSSADRSGFKTGDQVIEFADQKVTTGDQFLEQVRGYSPGDKVKAVVTRNGKEIELELKLGRFPDVEVFR